MKLLGFAGADLSSGFSPQISLMSWVCNTVEVFITPCIIKSSFITYFDDYYSSVEWSSLHSLLEPVRLEKKPDTWIHQWQPMLPCAPILNTKLVAGGPLEGRGGVFSVLL